MSANSTPKGFVFAQTTTDGSRPEPATVATVLPSLRQLGPRVRPIANISNHWVIDHHESGDGANTVFARRDEDARESATDGSLPVWVRVVNDHATGVSVGMVPPTAG
jgi:hypothetical protein